MNIESDKSLLNLNTFHIDAKAHLFGEIKNEAELIELLKSPIISQHSISILGGGSNILLTQNVEGLLIQNLIKGIELIHENDEAVLIKFGAGEVWHDCVQWCVERNYGGIENLSLIPGTIGAAPIQNIGAYGAELQDVFYELEAIDLINFQKKIFPKYECKFGYRNSIFKSECKGTYFITSVTLHLSKHPILNIEYGNIKQELEAMKLRNELTIQDISNAVIRIRQSKLPDPKVVGNAGSFFKNPVISKELFEILKNKFPEIPSYKSEFGVKIPAAWLIEQCKWKGFREGNLGVHAHQALCLVNFSDASGHAIFELSERIITSVQHAFNITLEREVNIW